MHRKEGAYTPIHELENLLTSGGASRHPALTPHTLSVLGQVAMVGTQVFKKSSHTGLPPRAR